ncbi:hypothetical protein EHF33_06850 [Deinococcus psychrotolerans]|uniref:Bacterial Pleckstrin homology domain-containing protein n=1 Tax=Deinococcus psychrotolerans TaxID=2489213 RepID=A0A3G8YLK9_9DEIO|nr:DUF6141 family protein [Deinococcus psychrotolerans]AZI42501.1 hypothetical protein EHF33_06850 [Deinococcus psychrotolerans]
MGQPDYLETQPLRQSPAVWLSVPFALLFWVLAFAQLILGVTVGNRPVSNLTMGLLWLGVGVALPSFFLLSCLKTKVDAQSVMLRLGPFPSRTIARKQIVRAYARTCDPIREYGGWGFRVASGSRRAYLASGTSGVELELVSGQRVFVGSCCPEELLSALDA